MCNKGTPQQSQDWLQETKALDQQPQSLLLDSEMSTLDRLAYACASNCSSHSDLPGIVDDMCKQTL